MNQKEYRDLVEAKPHQSWEMCNGLAHIFLIFDYQYNYGYYLKELLNSGVSVLVYNGDKDFICNWRGGEEWTKALVWDHQDEFINT